MKLQPAAAFAALMLAMLPAARGQDADQQTDRDLEAQAQASRERDAERQAEQAQNAPDHPKLDPKRIINGSYSFLKEREPDMTEEEDALYQRVALMVPTQPDFAMKLLENMFSGDQPVSPAFDLALANIYFNNGRRDDAEAHYRSAIKKYPDFLRAWTNLGILCYSAERYPEAVSSLSKAISLGDRDASTVGLMGYCLMKSGDPVAAEMSYLQAVALDPANSDWVEGLITIYQEDRQYSRAEPLARRLIHLKPAEGMSWLLYANILLAEGNRLEASAILETAAGVKAIDEDGLLLLGDLYAEQRFYPEATSTYEKAMARDPKLGAKRTLAYAQGLVSERRFDQAAALLQSLEEEIPGDSRRAWLETKVNLLTAQERWPEALKEVDALLRIDPLDGKALLRQGQIYKAQGDRARATFAYEQAYRLPGSAYAAALELSNLALQSRNYEKSIEYVEKALSIQNSSALQGYLVKLKALAPDNENNLPQQ